MHMRIRVTSYILDMYSILIMYTNYVPKVFTKCIALH
jgi:hypothetical protein